MATIRVKWEPNTLSGSESFTQEDLGCETMEEFLALSESEQRERIQSAFDGIPERCWPVPCVMEMKRTFDEEKAKALSDKVLAEAYELLMGTDWKRGWTDASKASEMRSILDGGIQPCVPFDRWVKVVDFILEKTN